MPPEATDSLLRWMGLIWLTMLGGCIGSFLNVVIYRVPHGQSISYPPSRCPSCDHAIRWYHNLPVVGWLVLRGRCYDCRAPIAARYPVVEGVMAMVFLVLAATGPLSAATWSSAVADDVATSVVRPYWIAYGWECVLLSSLLALAMVDRDLTRTGEGRFPLRLVAAVFLLALVLPILLPEMLVYTHGGAAIATEPVYLRTAVRHVGLGTLAGCGCGSLMFAASRGGPASLRQSALPALAGPYLGPWLVLELVAGTVLVHAALLLVGRWGGRQLRTWWSWPILFFLATFGGIALAHWGGGWPAAVSNPSLGGRLGIGSGLLVALLLYAVATRAHRDGPE